MNLCGCLCHINTLQNKEFSQSNLMQFDFVEVLILVLTVLIFFCLDPFLLYRNDSIVVVLAPKTQIVEWIHFQKTQGIE
jgi:hypothetical protein